MRALLLAIVLTIPALLGAASSAGDDPCGRLPGIGMACPAAGGYEVIFADGSRAFTHGLDPVLGADLAPAALAPRRDPPCIADESRDYHSHIIYAHPIDKPNRGAELTAALRGLVREANGLLYQEGAALGAPVEYRLLCEADGAIKVSIATIPVPTGMGDYTTLVNALTAQGFVNGHAKYWVWYDDTTACPCGGIAAAPLDPERVPHNSANDGPLFGATYGYMSARIPMHENGHNLGAVANSAPDTSGAAHCNDGPDIMCYADGGPRSQYTNSACTYQRFDCDHDTYFHPDPPALTWLASHWQIGAPVNRFVQGCAYLEGDILAPVAGLDTASVDVPAACEGHRYAIYGRNVDERIQGAVSNPVRLPVNVFSLCWYDGDALLECPTQKPWGHESRVPIGATRAVVTWEQGENGRYTLSII